MTRIELSRRWFNYWRRDTPAIGPQQPGESDAAFYWRVRGQLPGRAKRGSGNTLRALGVLLVFAIVAIVLLAMLGWLFTWLPLIMAMAFVKWVDAYKGPKRHRRA